MDEHFFPLGYDWLLTYSTQMSDMQRRHDVMHIIETNRDIRHSAFAIITYAAYRFALGCVTTTIHELTSIVRQARSSKSNDSKAANPIFFLCGVAAQ